MADRTPDGFDPVDPLERTLLRRVQAWTDQAVPSDDPAAVVRVTTAGLRRRPSPRGPGGRGPLFAVLALATAIVVGGLALRTPAEHASQVSPSAAGTLAAVAATSIGDVTTATPGPIESPPETFVPTAAPTPEPTPTAEPTSKPTQTPPKKTPRPDPDPTDSWHTDWTPPPGFEGTFTASFTCTEANGEHQVMYTAVFDSPVEVTTVEMFLDGDWFARGGPPLGDELAGEVIVGRYLPAGTTHAAFARFFTGPYNVDFIAVRETGTFTVPEGPLC